MWFKNINPKFNFATITDAQVIHKYHIYCSYSQNADSLLIFKFMIYFCTTAGAIKSAVGSSCGSHETLYEELALDWFQEPLKILGVTFSPLVFNIWDLNVNEILRKVKHLLNQWTKRKISLSGRITIIKSLAISKFVHLFISLPDPPNA